MSKHRRHLLRLITCLALAGLTACDASTTVKGPLYADVPPAADQPILRFAIHPLHNPQKLAQTYQPLIDALNLQLVGIQLELEASRDYAVYEEKIRRRAPELLLPNPWQTLEAMKVGYTVIAMAGNSADFKGLILVRKDSGIKHIADLKGREISYPSPTAVAACIMPQAFLQAQGLDLMHDTTNRYVGSQESSILNVYLKQTAAGATWPPPWRAFQKEHPLEASELMVAWETKPLVNNSVMVRRDLPAAVGVQVRAALLRLAGSPQGQQVLARMETSGFYPAKDSDYEPVRRFIADFERNVRTVENRH